MKGIDARGVCETHPDPDLWLSPGRDFKARALAKRLCEGCPLLGPCREWAIAEWRVASMEGAGYVSAVVGGLTEAQIRDVRKGKPLARPPGSFVPSPPAAAPPEPGRRRKKKPDRECSGCGRTAPHAAHGLCHACYSALRRRLAREAQRAAAAVV